MPVLTNPYGGSNTHYNMYAGATTSEPGLGTLYWYVNQNVTQPSIADLVAGTGAVVSGNVAKNSNPSQTINGGPLAPATSYYMHIVHHTDSYSNIVTTPQATTRPAPPVISAPTHDITASSAVLSCTSNLDVPAGGHFYAIIDTPALVSGVFDFRVVNGQNNSGSPALISGNIAQSGTNPQITLDISSLTAGETYGYGLVYRDELGSNSNRLFTETFIAVASGNVAVESISNLQWSIIDSVFNSARIHWNIQNSVEKESTAIWSLISEAISKRGFQWNLLSSASNSFDARWNISSALDAIHSDITNQWNVNNSVEIHLDSRWSLLNSLQNEMASHWNILQALQKDNVLAWGVIAVSNRSISFRWSLLSDIHFQELTGVITVTSNTPKYSIH